ncbi:DUF4450 domain-containing protein [Leeuwenhoekiella polynyae]|uniref:Alpha-L-rhamnosidase six-hairpin glycosidase domain-containing protein n=1 Tax=Leeuwenhoekiella polynyae TaxID=1550906 RepID=A0A4Q0PFA8_9FLAO|nr:DUF4450 domain-containing protein [Leeuwenhoekiella polynyae]RXG25575.1 putative protein DUF4450 [Leeuwenhoekiella polynyae]
MKTYALHRIFGLAVLTLVLNTSLLKAQEQKPWHDQNRKIHYKPDGNSFVLVNGTRKFNRALYGTNTGFRVETGDLPEFALYLPGMGGNFKLGISKGGDSKWITEADSIVTTYTPGRMHYEIRDALLEDGFMKITVVASADTEALILKVGEHKIPKNVSINWLFGGASGKKFHRDGDIGADPESVFYLQPEYAKHNNYTLKENSFLLDFNWDKKTQTNKKSLLAKVPQGTLSLGSANAIDNPRILKNSAVDSLPVVYGSVERNATKTYYWYIENTTKNSAVQQGTLAKAFEQALYKADTLANRVRLNTPDPYLNTLGGALATAADAIWEDPAFLHGAVAWRMHLNAWRGAYNANVLGWHDRAKTHFKSYGNAQVLEPETGPVVLDSSRNFARQKEVLGTSMFSKGYISRHPNRKDRAHHYDMNLVFIDQLLTHFNWNDDPTFLEEIFPVIERHLAWEKRNYDTDDDGLYDAYAAIWASDALQYSGGSVTYTSAYNYRANVLAAKLATRLGKTAQPYLDEAAKIKNAIQNTLWLPAQGVYAEYKDALGKELLHKSPGIWTVYHALDKGIADDFEAYESLNYVTREIPHIPVQATGLPHPDLELVSTTNWQPYTWSVNNVALAENLNMALAYWQGNQPENAYKLFESALLESMYLGASPGGFQQLSFYDAIRGELYRDFADPIGVASRALVEGLFGIQPDLLDKKLRIKPGFPEAWDHASLDLPDVALSFKRTANELVYQIENKLDTDLNLELELNLNTTRIKDVLVNGNSVNYQLKTEAIGKPKILIPAGIHKAYTIQVITKDSTPEALQCKASYTPGAFVAITSQNAELLELKDPQKVLTNTAISTQKLSGTIASESGNKMLFIKLKQDEMTWWQPLEIQVKPKFQILSTQLKKDSLGITIQNNTDTKVSGTLKINHKAAQQVSFEANAPATLTRALSQCFPGTNELQLDLASGEKVLLPFTNWDIPNSRMEQQTMLNISDFFNARVDEVFQQQYLSPRPESPTLQLPTTGVGNWCYPNVAEDIHLDDSGLREASGTRGFIQGPEKIFYATPSEEQAFNSAFTSKWDTYPDSITIPLEGTASHAYLMMAGTTNPMQTQLVNGTVTVTYTDGTTTTLELKNPENWWPIEQDYYTDGYAFITGAPRPPRVIFKTGEITRDFKNYKGIHGFTNYGIDGGAGTILDLPLAPQKTLEKLTLEAQANDVIIGLMSLTLLKPQRNEN